MHALLLATGIDALAVAGMFLLYLLERTLRRRRPHGIGRVIAAWCTTLAFLAAIVLFAPVVAAAAQALTLPGLGLVVIVTSLTLGALNLAVALRRRLHQQRSAR
ncbi:MAG: hypothetical protein ABIP33_06275 [Pseudolysinimonas sp.]